MVEVRAKRHRLPSRCYQGEVTLALTTCVVGDRSLFADAEVVERLRCELFRFSEHYDSWVPVYCFMPDHLHLMMKGRSEQSRPKRAMDGFKIATGIWLRNNRPWARWQRSYHDHITRCSEDWINQAFYMLNNPVRRGLVVDPYDYPFSGSQGYRLQQIFCDLVDR